VPYSFSMKINSALKRVGIVATLALALGIGLPAASNAEPGRTWEIDIDASSYADNNPSDLVDPEWCDGACPFSHSFYSIDGISAGDTFTFNISNVSNMNYNNFYTLVGWFNNSEGFSIEYLSDGEIVTTWIVPFNDDIETLVGTAVGGEEEFVTTSYDAITMRVTLGANPVIGVVGNSANWFAGKFGFISNDQYYLFRFNPEGQWSDSSGGGSAPRLTYGNTNSYADPTGELRSLINKIKGLSGNLIGWK
jgi:hypothetical protein